MVLGLHGYFLKHGSLCMSAGSQLVPSMGWSTGFFLPGFEQVTHLTPKPQRRCRTAWRSCPAPLCAASRLGGGRRGKPRVGGGGGREEGGREEADGEGREARGEGEGEGAQNNPSESIT